jgi:RNA polymerase sigma-70 factor (ECF subfamily)
MAEIEDPEAGDEALVSAAREGDRRAFETLIDRHEGRVLRTLRLLGVSLQDREDVAQEVFLRVFRHLDGFRRGRSFRGWLYRLTVNAAHDHRARLRRRAEGEAPWRSDLEGVAGAGGVPGEGAELRRALEKALGRLSERERAVFVLKELEGMETAEVARALGVTRVTVRRHLSLARRRLRAILLARPAGEAAESIERLVGPTGSYLTKGS